jgi:hypothetical protein
MPIDHILALLIAERDKLNRAIEALQEPTKRRGRPPKNPLANAPAWVTGQPDKPQRKKHRKFTAAQRKQQAQRMKQYWAAKKKAAARSQPKTGRKKTAKAA